MEFFSDMAYWHWFVLGLVLLILEMFAPGAILLWFGIAALLVGVLMTIMGDLISPSWQWTVFAVLSVASIVVWKLYARKHNLDQTDDGSTLSKRGMALVGHEFVLSQAIVNGVGKAKVGDSHWRVEGSDLAEGERVTVTACVGATLKVEPVK